MKGEPRYTHDCPSCMFLGQWNEYDLYLCPSRDDPTLIGRYGDNGGDYVSGLEFRDHIPSLKEAFRRACDKGLLDRTEYPTMVRCCSCGIIRDPNDAQECLICKLRGAPTP